MTSETSTPQISGYRLCDTESVFVQTNGAQLSVRDSGGDGEPIVFLSGGPGMPDYLEEIAKLVPGRRVVTYDQRGTGGSTATDGDYSTEAHVADLEQLREHLGTKRLHLFGHSWGGMLAQLYATAHVSSVASLFLCSPTPGVGADWVAMEQDVMAYSKDRSSSGAYALMGLHSLLGRIPRLGQRSLQKMYAQVWLNYQNPDTAMHADQALLDGIGQQTTFATRAAAVALPTDFLDSVLPQAMFPFYVMFGENDIYGNHTQLVVKRYPNATVELWPDCGHLPWLDAPARFENQLKSFFDAERDS
jgi:proline iminopeptidase